MSSFLDEYPEAQVRDLLWARRWHLYMVREIESRLKQLSKEHGIVVNLNDVREA